MIFQSYIYGPQGLVSLLLEPNFLSRLPKRAMVPPQMLAILEDPLDSSTSDVNLKNKIVVGIKRKNVILMNYFFMSFS